MKIMVASDLHLEHRNGLSEVLPQNAMFKNPDVLVLAGDIHSHLSIKETLIDFCELFPDTMILYTTGNHEYYSRSLTMDMIDNKIRDAEQELISLGYKIRFLNNESFSYQGIHFYGGCMWSQLHHKYPQIAFTDAGMINLSKDVGLHENAVIKLWEGFKDGLDKHIETYGDENTVVISHFSPSIDFDNPFIPPRDDCFLTYYFCAPMDKYIKEMKLKAWFYGHNHYSTQKVIEESGCLVASCQAGYPREHEVHPEPKPFTVFEI